MRPMPTSSRAGCRARVSAIVITFNEESNLDACLSSLHWADELLVIDAQSTDRTVEIARGYTTHVYVRQWPGYGPQKNFGIDRASGDWVLIVDADERVTDALREEISRVLAMPEATTPAGFEIPRRNFFYGRWIRGGGIYPDYQLRLFRRTAGRYDDTPLHERLQVFGPISRLHEPLDHLSMPTVRHHIRKMIWYTTLGAVDKLEKGTGVSATALAVNHLGTILKTYLLRRGYRDGVHGLVVALFAGMHTFVKYSKAWERLNQNDLDAHGHGD